MKIAKWTITVCFAFMVTNGAMADVVIFQPKVADGNYHDAFIPADTPNCATCSGVAWGQLARVTTASWYERTLMLQFDQLSAYIGGAESVTQAVLSLTLYYRPNTAGTPVTEPELQVFRVTNSWVNGATYNSRGGVLGNWATPGGDYDPTAMGSLAFSPLPADYSTHNWNVTALVSNWVEGTYANNGMLVKWTPGQTDFTREWVFMGSGVANAVPWWTGWEPKLTLYTIPESSSSALFGMTAAALGVWTWLRRGGVRR